MLENKFVQQGTSLSKLATDLDITETMWNLPFVYVYERDDLSVSYYAFLVYPDTVRRALQNDKFGKIITGKFTLFVDYNDEGQQELVINVELKHDIEAKEQLIGQIVQQTHDRLIQENSEYRETFNIKGGKVKPLIKLWPYESKEYFQPGKKQQWVKKNE